MIGRPRVRTTLLVCLGLVLAGAAADVWVLERPAFTADRRLKDQPANVMTQPQLEALLVRVAPSLPADIRIKLAATVEPGLTPRAASTSALFRRVSASQITRLAFARTAASATRGTTVFAA